MKVKKRIKNDCSQQRVQCEITAVHGYLNDDRSKVVATISWNGKTPKFNIRDCFFDDESELQVRKGITLDSSEVDRLNDILAEQRRTGILPKLSIDGKPIVDFSRIFTEADGIVEAREEGYTTKDGFIVLRRRPGVTLWTDKSKN